MIETICICLSKSHCLLTKANIVLKLKLNWERILIGTEMLSNEISSQYVFQNIHILRSLAIIRLHQHREIYDSVLRNFIHNSYTFDNIYHSSIWKKTPKKLPNISTDKFRKSNNIKIEYRDVLFLRYLYLLCIYTLQHKFIFDVYLMIYFILWIFCYQCSYL